MNKTKIEWCDYTVNPIKGLCPMACPYCYARRMYKRFKWDETIRFDNRAFLPLLKMPKGSKVFVGSTMELFGEWVGADAANYILRQARNFPLLTFIFLTKKPENLAEWSPFPDNCWVGVSATDPEQIRSAFKHLHYDVKAPVKFVSFEPLLGMIFSSENVIERYIKASGVNWVIIGQQTPVKTSTMPRKEWIDEIIDAADNAGIPIFLKDNLRPVLKAVYGDNIPMRQEFPKLGV